MSSYCENILFINCGTCTKKNYILEILNSGKYFFKTFIRLGEFETNYDAYGTHSDVYIKRIDFLPDFDEILHFTFDTDITPCTFFCKRFAGKYSVDIQLIYYNEELNFSGKYCIHKYQVILNEYWTYYQGLYYTNPDIFWERIKETFNGVSSFNEWNTIYKLALTDSELLILQEDFMFYHFNSLKIQK
jgi:hypothetical protein